MLKGKITNWKCKGCGRSFDRSQVPQEYAIINMIKCPGCQSADVDPVEGVILNG